MENSGLFNDKGEELSITDVMSKLPPLIHLEAVTRVEVIDDNGRSYMNWKSTNKTQISLQDHCRTLKIFICEK